MELNDDVVYNYLGIKKINKQNEELVKMCITASCEFIKSYCNLESYREVINDDLLKCVLLRLAHTFYHDRKIDTKNKIKIDELTKLMLDVKKKLNYM